MAKTTALGWGAKGTNALEGVETSPGKVGSESSDSKKKSSPKSETESPQLAPRTEPLSRPARKASSSAGSAGSSPKGDK